GGTTVVVFVRQPVTYSVSRPSALGEIAVDLHGRIGALQVLGRTPSGRIRTLRPRPPGRQTSIDAEEMHYDKERNVLSARGGATITREDVTITADEVEYDRTHSTIDAHGHVVIEDPEATTEADAAHLDMEDESGWVENADTDLRPSGYT